MKKISGWRPISIIAVTVICLWLFYPTARYFVALSNPLPEDPTARVEREKQLEEMRQKAIPLGLDLRGGIDVTLMLDQKQAMVTSVRDLAATLKNQFQDAKLSVKAGPSEDNRQIVVQLIKDDDARGVFNVLKNYENKLASIPSEDQLRGKNDIKLDLKSDAVNQKLRESIQGAEKVIRDRLDKFGLTQPSISIEGEDRIRIQVPGASDPEKLVKNLTTLASMEFRLTHELFGTPNDPITQMEDEKGELKPDAQPPLGYDLVPYRFGRKDKATGLMKYKTGHILVERDAKMTGQTLRNAGVVRDPNSIENPIKVSIQFDAKGTDAFGKMSKESEDKYKQDGKPRNLAILLDGTVISAPEMKVAIMGGDAVIEGGFNDEEARDLSLLLKAGSLPAPLTVESNQTVGASLGTESIFSGIRALFYGTLAVIVFMVIYYGTAGVISIVALVLNVLLVLAILSLSKATLTLSGIGGILLTIGMAVDANVLIYERMREELANGRPLRQALALGFDRAFSVIIDSHVTSLITALVLLQFTEGSVFGFALTMTYGLIANLYTGLTVTFTLCVLWFQWRNSLNLGKLRIFANTSYDFIKARWLTLGVSWTFILAGAILLFVIHGGLRYGVDFKGGLVADVSFKQPATGEKATADENGLRSILEDAGLKVGRVQSVGAGDRFSIRVETMTTQEPGGAAIQNVQGTDIAVRDALTKRFGADGFDITTRSFGPETGQKFTRMAFSVVILASFAILIYLWLRFEFAFGLGAVVALLHDLLITMIVAQLWGVEITLDAVAAMMILLGFSVNDTIVIFDRIRENTRKLTGKSFREICNLSMNQSLARTIITSGTVFLVVFIMLLVGGEGLRPFAKILVVGVIVGTYSSDFIATPIVYEYNRWKKNKVVATLTAKRTLGPEAAKDPNKDRTGAKATVGNVPRRRAV